MNQENTEKLIAIYPEMFYATQITIDSYPDNILRPSIRTSLVPYFGFECGDGWFELLADCIHKIKTEAERTNIEVKALQIKEKYGSLRFYLSPCTDKIYDIISEAEGKSVVTCDECGMPGKLRQKNRWIYTLCDSCLQKMT